MPAVLGLHAPGHPTGGVEQLDAGWLHLTRARNLFVGGLTATGPSHKSWASLQAGTLTLYEEKVRGEARVKTTLSLNRLGIELTA